MRNRLVEKKRSLPAQLVLPAYAVIAFVYIAWRIQTTITGGDWYFWPLVASEMLSVALTLMYLGTAQRVCLPVFRPAPTGRTVDVFIPTYNEPEEVVKMTLIAALAIRGIREVFLLDDGRRLNMRAMADALGAEYVARTDNRHAKAGNMNNGIAHSDAEFMLFLDCDHVPQPQIVERLLGYFGDERLAFVQTPQLFYNTRSIQFRPTARRPLWNEQSMFYESIQPSKNRYNAAFFCGSGALVRRAAIDSIGGFATGTATEDIHTSLRLHAKGWRSLFVAEQLAHGIAPIDLTEYHKQRTRWGAGSLGLLFRSPDSPLWARGLSPMQRLCYFNSTFSFTFGLQRIFYTAFPALLLFAAPFMLDDRVVNAALYGGIMVAFVAFSYLCASVTSDGTYHPIFTEQYNLANMFSHVMAVRGIVQVQRKFAVSAKARSGRRRSPVEIGLPILCAVLLAADLVGLAAWYASGRPWSGLFGNMAGLALFWNSLNLALIVPFLLFLRRRAAEEEPRCAVAMPSAPARLAGPGAMSDVLVTGLDLTGATVTVPGGGIEEGGHQLLIDAGRRGELCLPARVLSVEHRFDGGSDVHLGFGKLPPEVAVPLTLLLFHRVVPKTLRYGPVRSGAVGSGRRVVPTPGTAPASVPALAPGGEAVPA